MFIKSNTKKTSFFCRLCDLVLLLLLLFKAIFSSSNTLFRSRKFIDLHLKSIFRRNLAKVHLVDFIIIDVQP